MADFLVDTRGDFPQDWLLVILGTAVQCLLLYFFLSILVSLVLAIHEVNLNLVTLGDPLLHKCTLVVIVSLEYVTVRVSIPFLPRALRVLASLDIVWLTFQLQVTHIIDMHHSIVIGSELFYRVLPIDTF